MVVTIYITQQLGICKRCNDTHAILILGTLNSIIHRRGEISFIEGFSQMIITIKNFFD